jgi:predicted small lipoprotein YifL
MLPRSRSLTLVAVLGLVAMTCSACGRRGGLQPPDAATNVAPTASGPASARQLPGSVGLGGGAAAPDPAAVQDGDELPASAVAAGGTDAPVTTTRGAKRGYTIPKQPFFLDPLL